MLFNAHDRSDPSKRIRFSSVNRIREFRVFVFCSCSCSSQQAATRTFYWVYKRVPVVFFVLHRVSTRSTCSCSTTDYLNYTLIYKVITIAINTIPFHRSGFILVYSTPSLISVGNNGDSFNPTRGE